MDSEFYDNWGNSEEMSFRRNSAQITGALRYLLGIKILFGYNVCRVANDVGYEYLRNHYTVTTRRKKAMWSLLIVLLKIY